MSKLSPCPILAHGWRNLAAFSRRGRKNLLQQVRKRAARHLLALTRVIDVDDDDPRCRRHDDVLSAVAARRKGAGSGVGAELLAALRDPPQISVADPGPGFGREGLRALRHPRGRDDAAVAPVAVIQIKPPEAGE